MIKVSREVWNCNTGFSKKIYRLEPNTLIKIQDEKSKINGQYIISKMTIPLAYNGTMTINATKAVERLY